MMSQRSIIFLLVLMIISKHEVNTIVGTIGDIATISNFANDALAFANGDLPLENFMMGSTGFALDQIAIKIDDLSTKLEEMEANNERRMNHMLETLMNRLPLENRVEIGLSDLHKYIVRIDALYEDFEEYSKDPKSFNNITIMDFVTTITSHQQGGLQETLDNMHRLMKPDRSAEYRQPLQQLVLQKNQLMSFGELCGTTTSPQQRLFEIYRTVLISESRAYLMSIFSYAILTVYKNATFASEMKKSASQLFRRSSDYLLATKEAMQNSSLAVDVCDPESFERGKNFLELEQTIQMYIANEINIGWGADSAVCAKACSDYEYSHGLTTWPSPNNKNKWEPEQSCYGRLFDCTSSSSTSVCEMPSDSLNRYAWVKDGYKNTYGDTDSCPGRIKYPDWFVYVPYACDICLCTCTGEGGYTPAIRSISLRPALSDINANKVVTGIKFISSDKLIQIRIEQGELSSGGGIIKGSEKWSRIEKFQYAKNGTFESKLLGTFYRVRKNKKTLMKHGKDFTFITYKQRKINLDELVAPAGYVVTGVKFQHEGDDNYGLSEKPLQLAIRVTKFNYTTGSLDTNNEASYWISQENMPNRLANYGKSRSKVELFEPDNPTKLRRHEQIAPTGQYIEFTASDRKKDVGQSTVPFFDGQAVTTSISTPLSGLALIHRGVRGSGGILAFRLLTLDLFKYMNTEWTQEMIEQFDPKRSGLS